MEFGQAMIRLPVAEEEELLARVRAEGLPLGQLQCEYTRQQGQGEVVRNHGFIRRATISYDLHLCTFCGNLEGTDNNLLYCPAKLRRLQEAANLLPGQHQNG